ncbi:MAG: type Z 30S ribosomal protein S14 [Candidatus Curtissbacteria bacterium]|nr:type Z 30S ribosomal protein S14 [bacterium]MDZ4209847.1 type Z 30S ribosomal protein S14 [Candidatus Curtissbacteria bacterium]
MARKAKIVKQELPKRLKYSVRYRNRCKLCGRPRGYLRYFELCRLCFRELAHKGDLPGVKKASW